MPIDFQNDSLYEACKAIEPFLDRLVLVGGWAFRVQMNIFRDEDRYTFDADFAVQLASKEVFKEISSHLLSQGFQHVQVPNKLKRLDVLQYSFIKNETQIEILPFGEYAQEIIDLDLREYRLAFEENEILIIRNAKGHTLSLKIVTVPSLLIMKIFSFSDKWRERLKDLNDISYITKNYGKEQDKYGLTVKQKDWLEEKYIDYEFASTYLLGRKLQSKLQDSLFIDAKDRLVKILEWIRNADSEESERFKRLEILLEYFQDKYEPSI
ncbi:MAG: nucleotidyl transferase AbiEii/AbiGii toxin family protein [Chlorobium sp.]